MSVTAQGVGLVGPVSTSLEAVCEGRMSTRVESQGDISVFAGTILTLLLGDGSVRQEALH